MITGDDIDRMCAEHSLSMIETKYHSEGREWLAFRMIRGTRQEGLFGTGRKPSEAIADLAEKLDSGVTNNAVQPEPEQQPAQADDFEDLLG